MNYVDGFVAAVPTAEKEVYQRHCQFMGAVFKEHGALAVVDCWGDDVPEGKLTSFPQAVQLKDDEVAVFAWIVYASRAERDRINALVMKDPRVDCKPEDMPFDSMRMFWGGFTGLVERGWGAAP